MGFRLRVENLNGQFGKMGDLDKNPFQQVTIDGPIGIVPERDRP
jgi:hypothetical protein